MKNNIIVTVIFILVFSTVVFAEEVRFGMTPFIDYGPWIIAEEMGFFEEEGLDVKFVNLASDNEIAEAMAGGAIDLGAQSPDSALYFYPQNNNIRIVHIGTLFEGFAITGRNEYKTYNEFLEEGISPEEAALKTAQQMKDKVVITQRGSIHEAIVQSALEVGDLTEKDITIVDCPTPVEGVAAFIQGEGDFFTAGLPQTLRLLREGYPITLPGEALGPGGINFSGLQSSASYYEENKDVIVKFVKAWYKAISYLHQNDTEALSLMVNWLNKNTGAGLTVDEARRTIREDLKYAGSPLESYQWFYNKESRSHWRTKLEYRIEKLVQFGDIPENSIDLDKMIVALEIEKMVLDELVNEAFFE